MKSKISYLPLISEWENYIAITKKTDVRDFAFWLLNKETPQTDQGERALDTYFVANSEEYNYSYRSSEAAFLIWRLGKFIRYYTKPALLENGLAGQDDFAILSHIDYKNSCSKREAIEANIIDSTTGIEIIKRLIRQGLVSEKLNKEDKREKIVSLTKQGKETLKRVYLGFSKIQDVMAEMNIAQRELLIQTLKNLDLFHTKNVEILSNHAKKAD